VAYIFIIVMERLNVNIKDLVGLITIVAGIIANYFIVANQVSNNEARLNELTRKIEHLEVKDGEQDLIQNTLINDVKHIKEQTNQIYQIVVLNSLGG